MTGTPVPRRGSTSRQPDFRISCCLCGRPIGKSATHHGLDGEWRRRFPKLPGSLAHEGCAVIKYRWKCQNIAGNYSPRHDIRYRRPDRICLDSDDHLNGEGDQKAMVTLMPWSGLLQGAEDYLRYLVTWSRTHPVTRQQLEAILKRWDAHGGHQIALANSHWHAPDGGAPWTPAPQSHPTPAPQRPIGS